MEAGGRRVEAVPGKPVGLVRVVEWLAEPVRTARWLPRWGFANLAGVGLAFLIAIPLATAGSFACRER